MLPAIKGDFIRVAMFPTSPVLPMQSSASMELLLWSALHGVCFGSSSIFPGPDGRIHLQDQNHKEKPPDVAH